jgi:hypothetical protein
VEETVYILCNWVHMLKFISMPKESHVILISYFFLFQIGEFYWLLSEIGTAMGNDYKFLYNVSNVVNYIRQSEK